VRVGTVNIASGRDRLGRSVGAPSLAAAVAGLDADVLSVQELDTGQPRSHHVDRPAVLAEAFGALARRDAATVAGTPDPSASWRPLEPRRSAARTTTARARATGSGSSAGAPSGAGTCSGSRRAGRGCRFRTRAEELVRGPTFPAHRPRLQVDHLLALGGLTGRDPEIRALAIGDHRAAVVTVQRRDS
jgi:endonuclease/exonuclease/phosphatase family metal-dependent hydrolase